MGKKDSTKKRRKDPEQARQVADWLLRTDLVDHVREIYTLWTRSTREPKSALDQTTAFLAVCRESTEISQLIRQYRLASLACQVTNQSANVRSVRTSCQPRLYKELEISIGVGARDRIWPNVSEDLQIGYILLGMAARFGSGILLICSTEGLRSILTLLLSSAHRPVRVRSTFPPPMEILESMCQLVQENHTHIVHISSMLTVLADAMIANRTFPDLPSIDQICSGIRTAVRRAARRECSQRLDQDHDRIPLGRRMRSPAGKMLVDLKGMDRMLEAIISNTAEHGAPACMWPARLGTALVSPSQPLYKTPCVHGRVSYTHILPVLLHGRWTLFYIDELEGVVELLDFASSEVGCEMSAFMVRWYKTFRSER